MHVKVPQQNPWPSGQALSDLWAHYQSLTSLNHADNVYSLWNVTGEHVYFNVFVTIINQS